MDWLARLRQPRVLLVALHVPFIAYAAAYGVGGWGMDVYGVQWVALPLALIAGAIQIRHSLAVAAGGRPRYWQWSLAVLLLAAVINFVAVPLIRVGTIVWFVIASLAMLLPKRWAFLTASAIVLATLIGWEATLISLRYGVAAAAWELPYFLVVLLAGAGGLYAAAHLVSHAEELRATRAQLAELVIDHERLRISRDLHDLLGQSLSAIALKGDLATGLLERRELPRATAEIQSLVSVARSALHDLRTITHREPVVSLASELQRGTDLLSSVGIDALIEHKVEALPSRIDELFACAVREGITNVVRHSAATTCAISIARRNGELCLEIHNNGADRMSTEGHGLSGLGTRAAELAGSAEGHVAARGWFVLTVRVPEKAGTA